MCIIQYDFLRTFEYIGKDEQYLKVTTSQQLVLQEELVHHIYMTITGCTRQARVRAAQNQDLYEHYMDEGDEKQQIETKLIIGATSYNIFNSNAPLTQNTDQQKEQLTDTVSTHLLNEFDQFVLYWFMSSQYLVFYNKYYIFYQQGVKEGVLVQKLTSKSKLPELIQQFIKNCNPVFKNGINNKAEVGQYPEQHRQK
ncbi:unnamed protein product (macronuclear) [Paramecium tetraurelia]|uniref:Uncharacterized protein n=1 Tax=Paramecium tetraurelia TaxID=5888 RepID=A0CRX6_PARTE|nr:uncharacterized protein GSPATT00038893001 [Paramecium tetraurelia]CAK73543.1 unnamed protein product [Paramecium tetraurelia]|eukprot:XP_001440940.1 hypothetical protein (macronuclear) [Paramecium tetraurelia strain d4-2]